MTRTTERLKALKVWGTDDPPASWQRADGAGALLNGDGPDLGIKDAVLKDSFIEGKIGVRPDPCAPSPRPPRPALTQSCKPSLDVLCRLGALPAGETVESLTSKGGAGAPPPPWMRLVAEQAYDDFVAELKDKASVIKAARLAKTQGGAAGGVGVGEKGGASRRD